MANNMNATPRFCPSCGAPLAEGGLFCGECGALVVLRQEPESEPEPAFEPEPELELEPVQEPPLPEPMPEPAQQTAYMPVSAPAPDAQPMPAPKKKRSAVPLVLALVVVVAAGVAFMGMQGKGTTQSEPDTEQTIAVKEAEPESAKEEEAQDKTESAAEEKVQEKSESLTIQRPEPEPELEVESVVDTSDLEDTSYEEPVANTYIDERTSLEELRAVVQAGATYTEGRHIGDPLVDRDDIRIILQGTGFDSGYPAVAFTVQEYTGRSFEVQLTDLYQGDTHYDDIYFDARRCESLTHYWCYDGYFYEIDSDAQGIYAFSGYISVVDADTGTEIAGSYFVV